MEGEKRREGTASSGEFEGVGRLGGAQIIGIESAVRVQYLGKAQPYIGARRPLHAQPHDAGKILAKVVDEYAGPGLIYGFGLHGPLNATGLGSMASAFFH